MDRLSALWKSHDPVAKLGVYFGLLYLQRNSKEISLMSKDIVQQPTVANKGACS